jgi:hypothetical protein
LVKKNVKFGEEDWQKKILEKSLAKREDFQ